MNTTEFFGCGAIAFLAIGAYSAMYGIFVRRPLLGELRRQLQDLRAEVERGVEEGSFSGEDPGVSTIRKRLSRAHVNLHRLDLAHLLLVGVGSELGEPASRFESDNAKIDSAGPALSQDRKSVV